MASNKLQNLDLTNLPIQIHHVDKTSSEYVVHKHWHTQPEIIVVLEGSLTLELNNRFIYAEKDDIIFINSSVNHSAIPNDCVYISITFNYSMLKSPIGSLNSFIKNLENENYIIRDHFFAENDDTDLEFQQTVASLINASEKGRNNSIIISLLYYLIGLIIENKYYYYTDLLSKNNIFKNKELNTVLTFIQNNYNRQISLFDMAQSVNMSPKYFDNFFKKNTTQTPFEFLMQYRIEQASSQLIQTDITVTDIAYNVGFNDLSYFINIFKKFKGTSPLKFRKLHKNV